MIIDKSKPKELHPGDTFTVDGVTFAVPKLDINVPAVQKQQLAQAIITLVTVLLTILLTLASQFITQVMDVDNPVDPSVPIGVIDDAYGRPAEDLDLQDMEAYTIPGSDTIILLRSP